MTDTKAAPAVGGRTPKVSIAICTYNHERFIAQAIESVLMQEADFGVELVIGEDCSTDGTRAVVEEYARRYPGRIRPLLHPVNVGGRENFVAVLNACQGEYIAYFDGDDFWTSPHKLQRQVSVLESCPGAALCYHNVRVVPEADPGRAYLSHPDAPSDVTISELFRHWSIMTSSIVFRRDLLLPLPAWAIEIKQGDKMLQMLLAARGSFIYVDKVMSVYRLHGAGATQIFADPLVYLDDSICLFTNFNEWTRGKYAEEIHRYLAMWHFGAALQHRHRSEYRLCLRYALRHFRYARPFSLMAAANTLRKLVISEGWNESLSGSRVGAILKRLL